MNALVAGEEDRISELADEIIHDILERLRSPNDVAKATVLSKRWTHLWHSHPFLELVVYGNKRYSQSAGKSLLDGFTAAASKKISDHNVHLKSVTIVAQLHSFENENEKNILPSFIAAMLNLVANRAPEFIDIQSAGYRLLPEHLINHRRLETLKLRGCMFMKFSSEDRLELVNLRTLRLYSCRVNDDRFLNAVIAAAPLLETLTLEHLSWRQKIRRLEIRNNPNLKTLDLYESRVSGLIQIKGADSLETIRFNDSFCDGIDLSPPAPTLKSLRIGSCPQLTDEVLNNLISSCPSLQSLCLQWLPLVKEVMIRSPNLRQLKVDGNSSKKTIQIDHAPKLADVYYSGSLAELVAIGYGTDLEAGDKFEAELCEFGNGPLTNREFVDLNNFITKSSRQFRLVQLSFAGLNVIGFSDWDQVEDDSPAAAVVHYLEFRHGVFKEQGEEYDKFFDPLLWSCHPKYLCVKNRRPSFLTYLYDLFMKKSSHECRNIACKCWRHQLKNVKIVNTKNQEEEQEEEEEEELVDEEHVDLSYKKYRLEVGKSAASASTLVGVKAFRLLILNEQEPGNAQQPAAREILGIEPIYKEFTALLCLGTQTIIQCSSNLCVLYPLISTYMAESLLNFADNSSHQECCALHPMRSNIAT